MLITVLVPRLLRTDLLHLLLLLKYRKKIKTVSGVEIHYSEWIVINIIGNWETAIPLPRGTQKYYWLSLDQLLPAAKQWCCKICFFSFSCSYSILCLTPWWVFTIGPIISTHFAKSNFISFKCLVFKEQF